MAFISPVDLILPDLYKIPLKILSAFFNLAFGVGTSS